MNSPRVAWDITALSELSGVSQEIADGAGTARQNIALARSELVDWGSIPEGTAFRDACQGRWETYERHGRSVEASHLDHTETLAALECSAVDLGATAAAEINAAGQGLA
ncbi:MAG: hypothetical protein ACRCYQ_03225 [Nocardioides sp.]